MRHNKLPYSVAMLLWPLGTTALLNNEDFPEQPMDTVLEKMIMTTDSPDGILTLSDPG